MLTVIIGMLVALVLAAVVLALVAVPARREGRVVLTSEGEHLVSQALERTADAVGAAKDRIAERLPVGLGADQETREPMHHETIDLRDVPTPTPAVVTERASHRR